MYTDHEELKYVINMRDPHGRIARWMSLFAEFDFEVVYRPGEMNANADYLSRPVDEQELLMMANVEMEDDLVAVHTYLSTGIVQGESRRELRTIKMKAKKYPVHDGDMCRRTPKGLRFVP